MAFMEAERILWTQHISQWQQSPQTSKTFCDERELDLRIFHAWRKKLLREKSKSSPRVAVPPNFVPITPAKMTTAPLQEIKLELRGDIRLCWPVSGFGELAQQLREMGLL
jgi:hypothetical protein